MMPTPFCDQFLTHVQTLSNSLDLTEAKLLEYLLNASVKRTHIESAIHVAERMRLKKGSFS